MMVTPNLSHHDSTVQLMSGPASPLWAGNDGLVKSQSVGHPHSGSVSVWLGRPFSSLVQLVLPCSSLNMSIYLFTFICMVPISNKSYLKTLYTEDSMVQPKMVQISPNNCDSQFRFKVHVIPIYKNNVARTQQIFTLVKVPILRKHKATVERKTRIIWAVNKKIK